MLVIRRRPGEALVIGEDVEIEILESSASQVKLGIRAPKSVAVVRKEIRVVGDQNSAASRSISLPELDRVVAALKSHSYNP